MQSLPLGRPCNSHLGLTSRCNSHQEGGCYQVCEDPEPGVCGSSVFLTMLRHCHKSNKKPSMALKMRGTE